MLKLRHKRFQHGRFQCQSCLTRARVCRLVGLCVCTLVCVCVSMGVCVWVCICVQARIRSLEKEKVRMLSEIEVRTGIVEKDADVELDQVTLCVRVCDCSQPMCVYMCVCLCVTIHRPHVRVCDCSQYSCVCDCSLSMCVCVFVLFALQNVCGFCACMYVSA